MESEKIIHGKMSIRSGKAHIPLTVKKELASDTVGYILDANTVLLCKSDMSVKDLLKSVELLVQHIKLKIKTEGESVNVK